MPTDLDILTLTQWLSASFPVGAFAYSHGLESAVQTGDVCDVAQAQGWIADVLAHGAGRNDCILLATAYRADSLAGVAQIDAMARAFAASNERLQETDLQGAAFCDVVSNVWAHDLKGLVYPVAVGRAAALQRLPLALCATLYLHSFLSNLAAAAMRLVPLGQTEGQELIHQLTPRAAKIARQAMNTAPDEISATSFLIDIAAMKHETQYSRIFRT